MLMTSSLWHTQWSSGVFGKGVQANAVKCTVCKSGFTSSLLGDLSLVVYGFRCKRCDSTIQEAGVAEDVVVDGETYGCEKILCYLGDTLDGDV